MSSREHAERRQGLHRAVRFHRVLGRPLHVPEEEPQLPIPNGLRLQSKSDVSRMSSGQNFGLQNVSR